MLIDFVRFEGEKSAYDRDVVTSKLQLERNLPPLEETVEVKETLCTPYLSRALTTQVLIEQGANKISYYLEALASYYHANISGKTCIIHLDRHTTGVIPIQDQVQWKLVKSIPYGHEDAIELMLRLMVLKYPTFPIVMPKQDAEELVEQCQVALDYDAKMREYSVTQKDTFIKEYSYTPIEPLSEEEVAMQKQKQMDNRIRLRQMNLEKRKQKLFGLKSVFQQMTEFMALLNDSKKADRTKLLKENNYTSIDDVEERLKELEIQMGKLETSIKKSEDASSAMDIDGVEVKDELSEEYLDELRQKYLLLTKQIQQKSLDTSRRNASSSNRMKEMAKIIEISNRETDIGDNFGMQDSDWNTTQSGEGLDVENELAEVEELLVKHDPVSLLTKPTILSKLAHGGPSPVVFELHSRTVENVAFYNENMKNAHQIHLNVEKYKVPEILFKPYLGGLDQRGLVEILTTIYKEFQFQNIYISGSWSQLKGLKERLQHELQMELPQNTKINISLEEPNAAELGAKAYYKKAGKEAYMTKKDIQQHGEEFLKVHKLSNPYTE